MKATQSSFGSFLHKQINKQKGGTLFGILIGLLLGLLTAVIVAIIVYRIPLLPKKPVNDRANFKYHPEDPNKSLYQLNNKPNSEAPSMSQAIDDLVDSLNAPPAEKTASAHTTNSYFLSSEKFILQGDAENMRAKLSLLGVEAMIDQRKENADNRYQLRIGPFFDEAAMKQARARLSENGVNTEVTTIKKQGE